MCLHFKDQPGNSE